MPYDSTISFTFDTICPWTYLAKKRLDTALDQYRSSPNASDCVFTVKYFPYQLYPEASQEGEHKYEWYLNSRYGDSEAKMNMYTTIMTAYGTSCGIDFKFGGTIANTLHAHRLICWAQTAKGPESANKVVTSLYRQYFEEEKHPSDHATLLQACKHAGISEEEAKTVVENENTSLMDVKNAIREQAGNGVDAVPYIVFEGRKRDLALQGAKEVGEYAKVLNIIAKESL